MEKHIKERLVGAVVLVAIVVIVVPELLTGPRDRMPAPPPAEVVAPVRTVTIDLDTGAQRDALAADRIGDVPPVSGTPATGAPQDGLPRGTVDRAADAPASADAPTDSNATTAPPTSSTASSAPAVAMDPKPASGGAAAPKPAAESTADAARRSEAAVSAAAAVSTPASKPPAKTETVAKAPAASKPADAPKTGTSAARPATAESAGTPKVAESKPVAPARPAAPATSASEGWVVQLGSFASRPNAERLAAELRSKGYAGFVSEFRGSGRVLYRVRVGPEQDRSRAEAIAQRLARDGKKGSVAPHP